MTRNLTLRTSKLAATAAKISISSIPGSTAARCCQLKLLSQRSKSGTVTVTPSARCCLSLTLFLVLALTLLACIFDSNSDCFGSDMVRIDRCCACKTARNGTCENCTCVKAGKACTDCYLSADGLCSNSFGCGDVESKVDRVICPFAGV